MVTTNINRSHASRREQAANLVSKKAERNLKVLAEDLTVLKNGLSNNLRGFTEAVDEAERTRSPHLRELTEKLRLLEAASGMLDNMQDQMTEASTAEAKRLQGEYGSMVKAGLGADKLRDELEDKVDEELESAKDKLKLKTAEKVGRLAEKQAHKVWQSTDESWVQAMLYKVGQNVLQFRNIGETGERMFEELRELVGNGTSTAQTVSDYVRRQAEVYTAGKMIGEALGSMNRTKNPFAAASFFKEADTGAYTPHPSKPPGAESAPSSPSRTAQHRPSTSTSARDASAEAKAAAGGSGQQTEQRTAEGETAARPQQTPQASAEGRPAVEQEEAEPERQAAEHSPAAQTTQQAPVEERPAVAQGEAEPERQAAEHSPAGQEATQEEPVQRPSDVQTDAEPAPNEVVVDKVERAVDYAARSRDLAAYYDSELAFTVRKADPRLDSSIAAALSQLSGNVMEDAFVAVRKRINEAWILHASGFSKVEKDSMLGINAEMNTAAEQDSLLNRELVIYLQNNSTVYYSQKTGLSNSNQMFAQIMRNMSFYEGSNGDKAIRRGFAASPKWDDLWDDVWSVYRKVKGTGDAPVVIPPVAKRAATGRSLPDSLRGNASAMPPHA